MQTSPLVGVPSVWNTFLVRPFLPQQTRHQSLTAASPVCSQLPSLPTQMKWYYWGSDTGIAGHFLIAFASIWWCIKERTKKQSYLAVHPRVALPPLKMCIIIVLHQTMTNVEGDGTGGGRVGPFLTLIDLTQHLFSHSCNMSLSKLSIKPLCSYPQNSLFKPVIYLP